MNSQSVVSWTKKLIRSDTFCFFSTTTSKLKGEKASKDTSCLTNAKCPLQRCQTLRQRCIHWAETAYGWRFCGVWLNSKSHFSLDSMQITTNTHKNLSSSLLNNLQVNGIYTTTQINATKPCWARRDLSKWQPRRFLISWPSSWVATLRCSVSGKSDRSKSTFLEGPFVAVLDDGLRAKRWGTGFCMWGFARKREHKMILIGTRRWTRKRLRAFALLLQSHQPEWREGGLPMHQFLTDASDRMPYISELLLFGRQYSGRWTLSLGGRVTEWLLVVSLLVEFGETWEFSHKYALKISMKHEMK